jgi:acyl-CoA dehydrogenase
MTPELVAVRSAVRAILAKFDTDYWRRQDEQRSFPEEFFQTMAEGHYLGTLIPETYGGSEAGPAVASVIIEEINRAGGDAVTINAQMSICGTLVRHGSEDQKTRYLPGIAAGTIRCLSVAATESGSGADMANLQSTARQDGDGWVLNAKKIFISLAEHTRLLLLLVNSERGPTLFLLDRDNIGDELELHPQPMIVNRMTTTLFIDELCVPQSAIVGQPGQGSSCLMGGFAPRRIFAAAEAIGNARFLLDVSLQHAKTRETFNRVIGRNQEVQYPLAQAYAKVEASDLMRWEALRVLDAGEDAGGRSALAKILSSEAAWETARAAMTTFGGWSLTSDLPIERKLRESTVFVFNNLLLGYVAERVLGLPKAIE